MGLPLEIEEVRRGVEFMQAVLVHDVGYLAEVLGVEADAISFVDEEGRQVDEGGDLCLTVPMTLVCRGRRSNLVLSLGQEDGSDERTE